ncbi:D123-domain-containing protein [Trichocladium antarcticum]|uniref:D123-domain-containing protein n=1 Tax=Trichocladium antarcticum TaxID=1450529 RepID=A0AAN6UPC6_9PEZI|nr:D123-domain-containing protein [Trichocladium antarcticum]
MPSMDAATCQAGSPAEAGLRFPPVTSEHILHCSYDYWFPKYRSSCIRSRIIPLTPEFVAYIREDGIILADEGDEKDDTKSDTAASDDGDDNWEPSFPSSSHPPPPRTDDEPESDSDDDDDDDDEPRPARQPPNRRFPALHAEINAAIASLGGAVAPKLNWSSPKDATWISRHPNTMKCTSANDIYILLKSSSFISHDLDHAFDDTTALPPSAHHQPPQPTPPFTPVLVLRAFFNPLPSLEFRCFAKDRALVAIAQRDLNYYAFLRSLRPQILRRVRELFAKLRVSFPDGCFVFDVYIPEAAYNDDDDDESDSNSSRLGRARLIDINPWAPKTDPLLFDWAELLDMKVARPLLGSDADVQGADGGGAEEEEETETETETEPEDECEVRLVEHDDPAAYNFSSPQYSAHKLPRDVVDASMAGEGGIREFARRWRRITEGRAP